MYVCFGQPVSPKTLGPSDNQKSLTMSALSNRF